MDKGSLAGKRGAFRAEGKGSVRESELASSGNERSSFIHSLRLYLLSVDPCPESQSLKTGQKEALEATGARGPGGLEATFRNLGFCPKAKGRCRAVVCQRASRRDQVSSQTHPGCFVTEGASRSSALRPLHLTYFLCLLGTYYVPGAVEGGGWTKPPPAGPPGATASGRRQTATRDQTNACTITICPEGL